MDKTDNMSHSKSKIWVHAILGTKYRRRLITPDIEHLVIEAVKHQFIKIKCPVDIVNGDEKHLHALFLLHPNKSIAQVMKQVKGASSSHISNEYLSEFAWQVGYGAFSVSESKVNTIRNYIRKQKEHHKTETYEQEYKKYLKYHGLTDEDDE